MKPLTLLLLLTLSAGAQDVFVPIRLTPDDLAEVQAKLAELRTAASNDLAAALVTWTNEVTVARATGKPLPPRPVLQRHSLTNTVQLSANERLTAARAERRTGRLEKIATRIRSLTAAQLDALETFLLNLNP